MKHSEYVAIAQSMAVTAIKNSLINVALKWLPFLATGPLNFVLVKFASKVAEELADQGQMRIFFEYVDFRTNSQAKEFEDAMLKNHIIQKTGTEQEKKDAEAKLVIALNKLITLSK